MPEIRIDVTDAGVRAALQHLQDTAGHLQPVMANIGSDVKARIQEGFDRGTSPEGIPWAPLRVRKGKPLVDGGHLRNSINYTAEANSVTIGTIKWYAALQNFGGTIRPKNKLALSFMVGNRRVVVSKVVVPPRPFMPAQRLPSSWSDDVIATIVKAFTPTE